MGVEVKRETGDNNFVFREGCVRVGTIGRTPDLIRCISTPRELKETGLKSDI